MDKIGIVSRSSDSVDRGKSTCLLRFVLCLEKLNGSEGAIERWEGQVEEFKMSPSCKKLLGIEWNMFAGFSTLQILQKIQDDLRKRNIEPQKNSQTGSSSCQCSTTSIEQRKEMMEFVFRIQKMSRITRRDSCKDTGRFWVLERKRSGMELFLTHRKENGIPQPIRWWNDSQTQVIQYSRVSML